MDPTGKTTETANTYATRFVLDIMALRAVGESWVDEWSGQIPLLLNDDYFRESFLAVDPTILKAATRTKAWSELPAALVPGEDDDEAATGGEQGKYECTLTDETGHE